METVDTEPFSRKTRREEEKEKRQARNKLLLKLQKRKRCHAAGSQGKQSMGNSIHGSRAVCHVDPEARHQTPVPLRKEKSELLEKEKRGSREKTTRIEQGKTTRSKWRHSSFHPEPQSLWRSKRTLTLHRFSQLCPHRRT